MIYHVIQGTHTARVFFLTLGVPCAVSVTRGVGGVGWRATAEVMGLGKGVDVFPARTREGAADAAAEAVRILLQTRNGAANKGSARK